MKAFLLKLLIQILPLISDELRSELCKLLLELYKKAEKTETPWDNILVELLIMLAGCKREGG